MVLVLLLIGRESGARFFTQLQTVAMQNQSNCVITFDTQLKITLTYNIVLWDAVMVVFSTLCTVI